MKHEGRGIIRIGDKTDHGGQVISASSDTKVMGKQAALQDDMTFCPRCKGQFAIKPDGAGATHMGKPYAYHGDMTACGARLITSLDSPSAAPTSAGPGAPEAGPGTSLVASAAFDEYFQLLDADTGVPLPHHDYALVRANGTVEYGTTSATGNTHLLSATAKAESIKLFI